MCEMFRQEPEDKEKPITGVRDDKVRENGMCMSAGTDKTQDAEVVADRGSANKVHQGSPIVGMDPAGTFCPAAGTGLDFWAKRGHKSIKEVF